MTENNTPTTDGGDQDDEKTAKDMNRADRIARGRHSRGSGDSRTSRRSRTSKTPESTDDVEAETSSTSGASRASSESKTSKTWEEEPVSDRTNHSFYLRDDLKLAVRRAATPALLDFEEAYGADLSDSKHRNRHYRPLLLLLGARALGDLDPDEIYDLLESEDVLDDVEPFL